MRSGDYRVLYTVDDTKRAVLILSVRKRNEDTYNDLLGRMPQNIDWTLLGLYEKDDTTSGMQTLACSGGVCEIVDIT